MNMEINGVTLQADFMDADFMDKFEPALYTMRDKIQKSKSTQHTSVAAGYRELNSCIDEFFNVVWGDGTADRVFDGSKNVMVHLQAVAQIDEAQKQEKKAFNDFSNKYTQRQQNGIKSMQGHQQKQKKGGQYNRT